ncbi:MAG: nucleotidyltransferase domain-containing protein [Candidatus Omnitrophota bacterium]|jgi:predicted nucleotidyltransferase|nr:nucleotidyltransferase domain-containing protein [Candidatus Omnitrophota bacterium]
MKFHLSVLNLLGSETKIKIIKFLLSHEAAMSEREIASILNTSHMSVNRTMQELAELNLVHYMVVGKAHLWKVNRNSYAYRMLEKLLTNVEIWANPLTELKQTILRALPLRAVERVVLFGSIAKNAENPDSDIDVFILVKNAESQKRIEDVVERLSNECLEAFGNRLSPYILTEQQLKQKKDLGLIANVDQGIQIYPAGNGKA